MQIVHEVQTHEIKAKLKKRKSYLTVTTYYLGIITSLHICPTYETFIK